MGPGRRSGEDGRPGDGEPGAGSGAADRPGLAVEPPPPCRVAARDGTALLIRPLEAADRDELARAYEQLSDQSRRRRFFSAPRRLSETMLDYLTELDARRHVALVAVVADEPGQPGIGVARWIRTADEPTKAEAAVTVVDSWQGRGVGTQLLVALVDSAVGHGVTTFVADVLWENSDLLDTLRQYGARVGPSEPGIARVECDLPPPGARLTGTALHRVLVALAVASSP